MDIGLPLKKKGNTVGKLDGKIIIITGGAKGQGAAEVRLATKLGAQVIVTDILDDEGQSLADETGNTYVNLDVTSPEQWSNVAQKTIKKFGRIDGLVNNAGIDQQDHEGVIDCSPCLLYTSPSPRDRG